MSFNDGTTASILCIQIDAKTGRQLVPDAK